MSCNDGEGITHVPEKLKRTTSPTAAVTLGGLNWKMFEEVGGIPTAMSLKTHRSMRYHQRKGKRLTTTAAEADPAIARAEKITVLFILVKA